MTDKVSAGENSKDNFENNQENISPLQEEEASSSQEIDFQIVDQSFISQIIVTDQVLSPQDMTGIDMISMINKDDVTNLVDVTNLRDMTGITNKEDVTNLVDLRNLRDMTNKENVTQISSSLLPKNAAPAVPNLASGAKNVTDVTDKFKCLICEKVMKSYGQLKSHR